MRFAVFQEEHAWCREAALTAARALGRDERRPAKALLGGWRFAQDEGLLDRLIDHLLARLPAPTPPHLAAALANAADLPPPEADAADVATHLHRARLERECAARVPDDPLHRLAWALDSLRFLGLEIERRQRVAWAAYDYRPAPERDAEARTLWGAWLDGRPWGARAGWERRFLPAARRAFGAVARGRNVPSDVLGRVLAEVDDAFFLALAGGDGTPPWRSLLTRVLETAGDGPVEALARVLPAEDWDRVARCAVTPANRRAAVSLAFPEIADLDVCARRLARSAADDAGALERTLDLHVACRLLETWATPGHTDVDTSWAVVVQNRGRARGRLRAVLATAPADHLRGMLGGLDALYARTDAAVGRYCRDWALAEMARDFPLTRLAEVDPPCRTGDPGWRALDPDQNHALRTWVLLVALKGRLPHLELWHRAGTTGDHDATWGRLLADDLPARLRIAGLPALRVALADGLPGVLTSLFPTLRQVASLPGGRELSLAFRRALEPEWHPDVPLPQRGFARYVEEAHRVVAAARPERKESP